jgi:hypothetical protein
MEKLKMVHTNHMWWFLWQKITTFQDVLQKCDLEHCRSQTDKPLNNIISAEVFQSTTTKASKEA